MSIDDPNCEFFAEDDDPKSLLIAQPVIKLD